MDDTTTVQDLKTVVKDFKKVRTVLENLELVDEKGRMIIDKVKWNGLAKKSGIEMGDMISEFKIENLDRPNKALVYPFALILLFGFGFMNYRRK